MPPGNRGGWAGRRDGPCSALAGDSRPAAAWLGPPHFPASSPAACTLALFSRRLLNFSISGIRGRCAGVSEAQVWRVAIEGC